MSLADTHAATTAARITPKRTAPTGFEPGVKYDAGEPAEVTLALKEIPADEQQWRDEIKRVTTLDLPDDRRVEIQQVRYWGDPRDPMVYVRFGIRDREADREAIDYPGLLDLTRQHRKARAPKATTNRTRVVAVSDAQIGKVDHRGGTPELLARVDGLLAQLDDEAKRVRCDDVVIVDPGDLTEGFENTAQQAHTNDRSFPEQLDLAQVVLDEIVGRVAARHTSTRVATVPSNHGAWRRGKDRLGKPGDDFGIGVHRAVARAYAKAKRDDVTFIIPDAWDESLALQVRGAVLGVAHGHQVTQPNGVPGWWAKQTHGGMPLAAATILLTGHFHHLRLEPSGAIDGRARWWMQAPTMDNGSSWWANAAGGSDCEPGILTFTIDDDGAWDNLKLITA
ncbi:hypothetical protein [Cellulosimicrobium funkei]|uniref:hypothetical protein n=1 Tax=Cellulosimicrobium funkei TaxID=264251 RepID=UPI003411F912